MESQQCDSVGVAFDDPSSGIQIIKTVGEVTDLESKFHQLCMYEKCNNELMTLEVIIYFSSPSGK